MSDVKKGCSRATFRHKINGRCALSKGVEKVLIVCFIARLR